MLTSQNVAALQDWLWACGVVEGLDAIQAHALFTDLLWIVDCIITEALDRQMVEWQTAALLAAGDCLDEQRQSLFRDWQAQLTCPR